LWRPALAMSAIRRASRSVAGSHLRAPPGAAIALQRYSATPLCQLRFFSNVYCKRRAPGWEVAARTNRA
jgi:hypothetical protein